MKKFEDKLIDLLKSLPKFVDEKTSNILRNEVVNSALKIDKELISLLIKDKEIKEKFFSEVSGYWVFKTDRFIEYIQNKEFLNDTYTKFKNKIGLTIDNKFIGERDEVALSFPFKDCILEGGMTKEDDERNEIFFNEILAQDQIDRLLDNKVLTNFKRYSTKGEERVTDFKRDKEGTIRENLIIKGNNLLAMHSIKNIFQGKIKLIYIDPPYYFSDKKEGDTFAYNPNFRLSTWLVFMKNRLEVAKTLLKKEGSIFVQISDEGAAHLKLLLDEVFGVENFINVISIRMKNIAGASGGGEDKKLKKNIEFIYIYSRDQRYFEHFNNIYDYKEIYQLVQDYKENEISWKYTAILYDEGTKKYITSTKDGNGNEIKIYKRENPVFKSLNQVIKEEGLSEKEAYHKYIDRLYTTAMPQSSIRLRVLEVLGEKIKNDELVSIEYVPRSGRNKGKLHEQFYKGSKLRLFSWLKDVSEKKDGVIYKKELQGTYWDGFNLNNLSKEGQVQLENGKKPEALLQRIIDMATEKEDIILDYHLGSGTTCAVAHKTGRQYIGIEQLDYGKNDAVIRLKNVINGDKSGISMAVNWKSEGEFIYCELMKFNEKAIEMINSAKNTNRLLEIWKGMCEKYFLNYNIEVKKFNDNIEEFKELQIGDQKKVLIEMLNKNQLYVNLSEINDSDFKISNEDKELNKKFYSD